MKTATLLFAASALLLSLNAAADSARAMPEAAREAKPVLVHRVEPKWPREAQQENISGVVTARLTIDAQGNVTDVAIVRAYPRRLFERPAVDALSQWRYNEGAAGRSVEAEIAFQLTR